MANSGWKCRFLASTITHLVSHTSDHLPLLMQTGSDKVLRGNGTCGFKFEEAWLLWDDYEKAIEEAWIAWGRLDSAMAIV